MKKQILAIGTSLSRDELKLVSGGDMICHHTATGSWRPCDFFAPNDGCPIEEVCILDDCGAYCRDPRSNL